MVSSQERTHSDDHVWISEAEKAELNFFLLLFFEKIQLNRLRLNVEKMPKEACDIIVIPSNDTQWNVRREKTPLSERVLVPTFKPAELTQDLVFM